jgi:hypothetical protein
MRPEGRPIVQDGPLNRIIIERGILVEQKRALGCYFRLSGATLMHRGIRSLMLHKNRDPSEIIRLDELHYNLQAATVPRGR